MSKGIVGLCIPRIESVKTIWDKVFFKLRVYFYGMVIKNKVLLGCIFRIKTHAGVIVEVIEVQNSIAFELFPDKEFI